MALIDVNILIKQCLPPHWRGGYKEHLCQVFCAPLHGWHRRFVSFKRDLAEQGGVNSQVAILEYDLNKIFAKEGYKFIELTDGDIGGQVRLLVHKNYEARLAAIVQELMTRVPAGVEIQVKIKE